jgi:hypothetical protein
MKTISLFTAWIFILGSILVSPCLGTDTQPELKMMDSIGTAKIQGGKLAESRENAIQVALMTVIDRLISDMYSSEAAIAGFQALNENLVSKANQFIQGYRVLTEGRTGEYYRVMIRAGVSISDVQKQLENLGVSEARKNQTSILLMIAEQIPGKTDPVFWWGASATGQMTVEDALAASLSEKGFLIVHHGQGSDPVFASIRQSVEPDLSALAEVGASLNAEYIAIGKAVVQPGPTESGMSVSKGLLKIRVIRPKTGKEIGSAVQTATATHPDEKEAIEQMLRILGHQAGNELVKLLQSGGSRSSKNFSMIDVTIEGVSQFKYYAAFRKTLNSATGVKTLIVKEMKPDVAILGVDFQGSSQQLADALMTKVFDGFTVTVKEISTTGLILTITPKQ